MSLFCKPISSSFFTNSSKYNLILDILDISRLFKNFLSEEIRKEFFFDLSLTPFDFRNKFRINFYEEQFERIFYKYNFSIKRIIEENVSLQIHNLIEISEGIYQFDSKRLGHKKMRELVLGLFDQYAEK